MALLGSFCAILWAVHVLRRRLIALNELYLRALGPLLRPHEVASLPGAFWFVLGSAIAIALFPQDIALQRYVVMYGLLVSTRRIPYLFASSAHKRGVCTFLRKVLGV